MIEPAAYEQNPLMQTIRSEHGTRKASEGTSNLGASLQDEFRSGEREGGPASGIDIQGSPGIEGSSSRDQSDQRTPKRRDSREGRTDTAAHKGDGGSNSHLNPISRAFQQHKTDDGGLNEEKPSGLYTKPNFKEQRARETDQSNGSPIGGQAQSKKNFFSWLRSGDNRKTAKEPRVKRSKTRPLTEKEAEELKPDLVDALRDGLPLLDQIILATNKAHAKPYIFASFDDEDIDKMAVWWLKKARKSGEVAAAAQQFVAYHDDVEILLMILPTLGQTFEFYRQNGGVTLRGR